MTETVSVSDQFDIMARAERDYAEARDVLRKLFFDGLYREISPVFRAYNAVRPGYLEMKVHYNTWADIGGRSGEDRGAMTGFTLYTTDTEKGFDLFVLPGIGHSSSDIENGTKLATVSDNTEFRDAARLVVSNVTNALFQYIPPVVECAPKPDKAPVPTP